MKKTNPHGDNIIRPFPGNTHDKTRIPEEGGSPPCGSSWTARLKRRWNTMLEWLAMGAQHTCPT